MLQDGSGTGFVPPGSSPSSGLVTERGPRWKRQAVRATVPRSFAPANARARDRDGGGRPLNPPNNADAGGHTPSGCAGRAERLVEKALREEEPAGRAVLAREAVAADDSNPDAWGILAESEEDLHESARLFGEALSRAEAALGPEAVAATNNEQKGDPAIPVWDDPAGLAYLRARAGLGLRLALLEGREREATEHLLGVLRLDPDDELDVSHAALPFLLELATEGADRDVAHVMATHPCDCAHHLYADLLIHYRRFGGDDERTKRALVEAVGSGPLIGPFLYGAFAIPAGLPPADELAAAVGAGAGGPDDERRALLLSAATAAELEGAWKATPAAGEWLEQTFRDLATRVGGIVGDPDSPEARTLAGTGAAGLSYVLGLADHPPARTDLEVPPNDRPSRPS